MSFLPLTNQLQHGRTPRWTKTTKEHQCHWIWGLLLGAEVLLFLLPDYQRELARMVLLLMFHTLSLYPPIRPNSEPGFSPKSDWYTGERESKCIPRSCAVSAHYVRIEPKVLCTYTCVFHYSISTICPCIFRLISFEASATAIKVLVCKCMGCSRWRIAVCHKGQLNSLKTLTVFQCLQHAPDVRQWQS